MSPEVEIRRKPNYSARRAAFALSVAGVGLISACCISSARGAAETQDPETTHSCTSDGKTFVIGEGDSLWAKATEINPEDVNEGVRDIVELNAARIFDANNVQPGRYLVPLCVDAPR